MAELLKIFRISKSSYYYTVKAIKAKEDKDKELREEILEIYNKSRCRYGFKRITLVINKNRQAKVNHKRVQRIILTKAIMGLKKVIFF